MCTKHGPKLTQTSLISKPRVVFLIRVIFELSIGNCRVLRTVFANYTHSLIKLVFINKVIASSPDCNIKKTQQGPNQSVVSCQTCKKRVEQDPVYKNSDNILKN